MLVRIALLHVLSHTDWATDPTRFARVYAYTGKDILTFAAWTIGSEATRRNATHSLGVSGITSSDRHADWYVCANVQVHE